MVKIFFFLMILSTPNQPSVKYTAAIYTTEEQCNNVLTGYMNAYESKSQEYKEPITPHGKFENPKNINRSKIMIEFLVETLERLNIDVVNNIEKHDIIENE